MPTHTHTPDEHGYCIACGEAAGAHTATPWYVGAQNDVLYIIAGRPPSKNNDYPVHDADRTIIAKVYNEADAQPIVTAVNAHDELVEALETLEELASYYEMPNTALLSAALHKARTALAKAKGDQ